MDKGGLGLIASFVSPGIEPDGLDAAGSRLGSQPRLHHMHQARFAAAPRPEDSERQGSEAALSTNVCQHLDVGAESEKIMKCFFIRPHRLSLWSLFGYLLLIFQ